MTAEEYMAQMGYAFLTPNNSRYYPPTIWTAQDQALLTEMFWQNQSLFRRYTAVDGSLKKQIIIAVQPVFLYPLVYQLTSFGQVSDIQIIQHLFTSYGVIDKIDLK